MLLIKQRQDLKVLDADGRGRIRPATDYLEKISGVQPPQFTRKSTCPANQVTRLAPNTIGHKDVETCR